MENPGSDEAIAAGCKCPVMDNNHGEGVPQNIPGGFAFWVNNDCPLHGRDSNWPAPEVTR